MYTRARALQRDYNGDPVVPGAFSVLGVRSRRPHTAETQRSRRQVRAGRDRAPLQDRAAGDRTRRADGQPPRVLRVPAVSEQRAQARGQPGVPGQVRAAAGEDRRGRRQGRGRRVPRDALLPGRGEPRVRDAVRAAGRADVQPVRVAVEVRGRQQLGRVRQRHGRGGLRAAGGVPGVRGRVRVRQGRRRGHVAVPGAAAGDDDGGRDASDVRASGRRRGRRRRQRDTDGRPRARPAAVRRRPHRVRRVRRAAVTGLRRRRVRVRLLVLLPRRRHRQVVVEKCDRLVNVRLRLSKAP